MSIAFFRDSTFPFHLARLVDSGVHACKGDKVFMGLEMADGVDFGKEGSACGRIDPIDGRDDFEVFDHHGPARRPKEFCHFIESFHEVKEGGDFSFKDGLFSEAYRADRGLSCLNDLFRGDREFAASRGGLKGFGNSLWVCHFDEPWGGERLEEVKHGMGEEITELFQFREEGLKDPFNFIFSRGDKVTEGFSFSGNISEVPEVLGEGELRDGILVEAEELSDRQGIFLIGFGHSQGQLSEVRDQQGVYNRK